MSKTTKRTYIALILAGLIYNIYLTCDACGEARQIIPTHAELRVFGIHVYF